MTKFSSASRIFFTCTGLLLLSCSQDKKLFTLLEPKKTGVDFVNRITPQDTLNILDNEFVYNGGGVAIGDLNNDGLPDLYFTGNQVPNKLYLNKGDLAFEDITSQAKVNKEENQWSSSVTMVDINRDGKLDIYVCNTMSPIPGKRNNLLFINQGNNEQGVPRFIEQSKEYNLQDESRDSAVAFFDFDNDGDLDIFLAINFIDTQYPNQFITRMTDGSSPNRDRLLRNDWDATLNHPVFTDVSMEAGIVLDGYSHSVLINDFNQDGWQDIYVCNDYLSNDLLYINNKNGTFTDQMQQVFKHSSMSAMGSDLGDINNDGRVDIMVNEMLPVENKRKKLFLNANNYTTYLFFDKYKYGYQYVRNTLQLHRGTNPLTNLPIYSDISFLAGVQETEWSWTPLVTDFDNDGYKDILVTNGFPKDITDHDFGAFRGGMGSTLVSKDKLHSMIPEVKVNNFLFRNRGDLTFEDVSAAWGSETPSFSNGAAYADLDNDGDLDYVVNNINDYAFIFRNNSSAAKNPHHWVRINLEGPPTNPDGYGSEVRLFANNTTQLAQALSTRGYLSKSESFAHFGLGKNKLVDSVEVRWPDGKVSRLKSINIDQVTTVSYSGASNDERKAPAPAPPIFTSINQKTLGLDYFNEETDYIDYNFQRTLPHKFSQYGPGIAIGDITGDGLDDIVLGASARFDEVIYTQRKDGTFQKNIQSFKPNYNKKEEDLGLLLFDADGDNDNDLYIARGSYQHSINSPYYQHLLCVNDGKGNFTIDSLAIGKIKTCGSSIKAADYDQDGDLDLFVGGRVLPKSYPKSDKSFILRNDSNVKDKLQFTDVTSTVLPGWDLGLISDALWSDFDNDNKVDLILAGEWMPLTFLRNTGSAFENATQATGIADKVGWWNSLCGDDFDNDGDTDYVAGNFGLNTYFKCSSQEPLTIYAKDFDNNGLYDPFISCYWRDSTGKKHEYFYHTRDDMTKQLVMIRAKFQTYGQFGAATVDKVFSKEELEGAQIIKANWMSSSYVENQGNGKFLIRELPIEAQFAPIYGMQSYDYNQDGLLDILLVGNDHGMELLQGHADALNGLVLKNNGQGSFQTIGLDQSHFFVPGDARAISRLPVAGKGELIIATQNRDSLKIFKPLKRNERTFSLQPGESRAEILLKNGKIQKRELYWGSTFLAQEPRTIGLGPEVEKITLFYSSNKISRVLN